MCYITTRDIFETKNLIRTAAFVAGRSLGVKKGRTKGARKEPSWNQRLKKKIDELRKDIRTLNCMLRRGPIKRRVQGALEHKSKTKEKGLQVVLEELKQRVTAEAAKI